jgi:hypothetical protein
VTDGFMKSNTTVIVFNFTSTAARRRSTPATGHGSVRLFHFAASHETCAMTFRFHETKKVLKTSILGGNGKVLKRDGFMIAA